MQGHKSGRWYIKRDLYDWWKAKIMEGASVGHRYFCLMALAVYATKCAIPEEEFKADLLSFVEPFDGLSYTRKEEDRFTVEDALDAAAAFKESYCTFPIEDLRDITGIEILRNQTRKFRKQEEHLKRARIVRDGLHENWREGNGRKSKQQEVLSWIVGHPSGTKYSCAKELGIKKDTVRKWWIDNPDEAAAILDRITDPKLKEKAIIQKGADYMYKQVSSLIVEPAPKEGDKERLDELFKTLIDQLPPEINREDFINQMFSRMPDYFSKMKEKKVKGDL